MKLYYHPKSPNGTAVVAVARELGIPLDLQEINCLAASKSNLDFCASIPTARFRSSKMAISSYGSREQSCNIWLRKSPAIAFGPPMIELARILVDGSCGALANGAEALES